MANVPMPPGRSVLLPCARSLRRYGMESINTLQYRWASFSSGVGAKPNWRRHSHSRSIASRSRRTLEKSSSTIQPRLMAIFSSGANVLACKDSCVARSFSAISTVEYACNSATGIKRYTNQAYRRRFFAVSKCSRMYSGTQGVREIAAIAACRSANVIGWKLKSTGSG